MVPMLRKKLSHLPRGAIMKTCSRTSITCTVLALPARRWSNVARHRVCPPCERGRPHRDLLRNRTPKPDDDRWKHSNCKDGPLTHAFFEAYELNCAASPHSRTAFKMRCEYDSQNLLWKGPQGAQKLRPHLNSSCLDVHPDGAASEDALLWGCAACPRN